MKPFREARLLGADPQGITVALDAGWRCRITLPAEGIGRVLLLPPDGLREPRTWAIAQAQNPADPWSGADRLQLFAPRTDTTFARSGSGDGDQLTMADAQLRVHVTLAPFMLTWEQRNGAAWLRCLGEC